MCINLESLESLSIGVCGLNYKMSLHFIISRQPIMFREELKSFCNETSIHGLGQIANNRASIIKRLLWLAIFVGCLAYAGQQLVLSIQSKSDDYTSHF